MEYNDPVGYKSRKAEKAKKECKITSLLARPQSPRLQTKPKESMAAFKQRLRRTALAIPSPVIRKAVAGMKKRARAIYDANSHDIATD